jgi:hypothetical protein
MHVCWLLVANEDINTWHATTTSSLCKLEMNSVAIAFDGTRAVQLDALVRGSVAWLRRLPYQIMIKAIAMDMVLGRVARAVGEALWQTNAWVGKAKGGMGWRRQCKMHHCGDGANGSMAWWPRRCQISGEQQDTVS